jgi:hypothetical protein
MGQHATGHVGWKFRQAATEAKRLLQDPQRRAYYEAMAARKHLGPFAILVGELLRGEPLRDVAAELESMRQAAEPRREAQRRRAELERQAGETQSRRERNRTESNERAKQRREAKTRERAMSPAPSFAPAHPFSTFRPLSVDEILTHVRSLTPTETRCLKSKLDELLREAKGEEQRAKSMEQGGKG